MSLLCRNTDGEVVQVVKLRYVRLKLAVVCGSFAPELGVGLRSSSRRAEHSLLTARSHPMVLQLLSSSWLVRGRSSLHGLAVTMSLGDGTAVAGKREALD